MAEKSKRMKNGTLTSVINLVKNKAYTGILRGYAEKHVLFCGWRTIAGYSWEVQFGNNYGNVERASLTHKRDPVYDPDRGVLFGQAWG